MISEIFTQLTNAGQAFLTFMQALINGVLGFFGTEGTGGTYTLNPIGYLTIAGVAIGFVWLAIRWITRLIKLRG